MQIENAIIIIREYQDRYAIKGLLETIEEMHLCFDDLTFHEAQAYRIFMDMAQEFFAPKETA